MSFLVKVVAQTAASFVKSGTWMPRDWLREATSLALIRSGDSRGVAVVGDHMMIMDDNASRNSRRGKKLNIVRIALTCLFTEKADLGIFRDLLLGPMSEKKQVSREKIVLAYYSGCIEQVWSTGGHTLTASK